MSLQKAKYINHILSLLQLVFVFYLFGSVGLTIFLLLMALVYRYQDRFIYIPQVPLWVISPKDNPKLVRNPQHIGLQYENVEITTKDGVILRGWLVSKPTSKRIVVYFHGNMAQLWWRIPFINFMVEKTDSDLLIVAYRGFSNSDGIPSQLGLQMDSHAIMDYAINFQIQQRAQGRLKQLFIYGRSLGGAVSIQLSSSTYYKTAIKGIILENTFTSLQELFLNKLFFLPFLGLIKTNQWNSLSLIGSVQLPIMFVRSLKDHMIQPSHMKALKQSSSRCPFKVDFQVQKGKHQPIWYLNPGRYSAVLCSFFQEAQILSEKTNECTIRQ